MGHRAPARLVRPLQALQQRLQRGQPARQQVAVLQQHPEPARGAGLHRLAPMPCPSARCFSRTPARKPSAWPARRANDYSGRDCFVRVQRMSGMGLSDSRRL